MKATARKKDDKVFKSDVRDIIHHISTDGQDQWTFRFTEFGHIRLLHRTREQLKGIFEQMVWQEDSRKHRNPIMTFPFYAKQTMYWKNKEVCYNFKDIMKRTDKHIQFRQVKSFSEDKKTRTERYTPGYPQIPTISPRFTPEWSLENSASSRSESLQDINKQYNYMHNVWCTLH